MFRPTRTAPGAFLAALFIVCCSLSLGQSDGAARAVADEFQLTDVVAQRDLTQTALHTVTDERGMHLGGVHVHKYPDGSLAVYVHDSGNNRVLGYLNPDWTSAAERPDIVLGQDDSFTHSACNGDNRSILVQPTARTLCLNRGAHSISQEEEPRKTSMDTDAAGNLYVIDQYNNRALMFRDPFGAGSGTGDSTADAVWGQADFQSKTCNRGAGIPYGPWVPLTAGGLCTTDTVANSIDPMFVTSLDIDPWGNMWVTDIINNRVLRFPFDAAAGMPRSTADIVLGQPTMTARTYNMGACDAFADGVAFCQLISLKINDETGELFVVHNYESARISVYTPDTTTQNPASYSYSRKIGDGQLNYPGFIHFLDADRFMIEDEYHPFADLFRMFTTAGELVRSFDAGIVVGPTPDSAVNFIEIHGKFTIVDGLLFIAEQRQHNSILVFDATELDSANRLTYRGELLGGGNNVWNTVSALGVHSPYGMAVSRLHDQLYVSSGYRILVWDVIPGVPFAGRDANYVIGQPTFGTSSPSTDGPFVFRDKAAGLAVDEVNGKLWVARFQEIYVFDLPITQLSPVPVATFISRLDGVPGSGSLPVLGQAERLHFRANSLAVDPIDQSVWLTDTHNSRVLRIANPYTAPQVDLIVGQNEIDGLSCNRGTYTAPTSRTLCFPGFSQFDSSGNLYISEGVYEGRADMPGNKRIVQYDRATITAAVQAGLFSEPAATRVYTVSSFTRNPVYPAFSCLSNVPCNPIGIAFDAADRMIVTSDAYFNQQNKRMYVYSDPLKNTGYVAYSSTADYILPYSMGQGGQPGATLDNQLFVQDHTWNRIMVVATQLTPGVVLSKAAAAVTEGGPGAIYSIRLSTSPESNVTIGFEFDQAGALEADTASLTFTPTNWKVPQDVELTAVDDDRAAGPREVSVSHTIASADGSYAGVTAPVLTVSMTDDDHPGVTVTESSDTTYVVEGSVTDSYAIVLLSQPASDVTLTLTTDPDGQITAEPSSLTFTPETWGEPQTVVVSALSDPMTEGPHTAAVIHTAASADPNYDGIAVPIVAVVIAENETPGIAIAESGGMTRVSEGGGTDTYSVVLRSLPVGDVTVLTGPTGDVSADPALLVFTPDNWYLPQTITVGTSDDDLPEGTQTGSIGHSASGGGYDGIDGPAVAVEIIDDDPAAHVSVVSLDAVEAGPSAEYSLVLTTRPVAPVVVTALGDSQCIASPAVEFGVDDWDVPHVVSVTAVNDAVYEGDHSCVVTHAAASADPAYDSIAISDVLVALTDNDFPSVELLTNTGFEAVAPGSALPDAWRIKAKSGRDKLVCKPTKAHDGACAVRLVGGRLRVSKTQVELFQRLASGAVPIAPGDTLSASAYLKIKGVLGPVWFIFYVSDDGQTPYREIRLKVKPSGSGYTLYTTQPYIVTDSEQLVHAVGVRPKRKIEKLWIDTVSALATPFSPRRSDALPLSPPDGMRGLN